MQLEQALDLDTGGEADYYELASLDGIQALRSLEKLDLDGYGYREADLPLEPLRGHPSLAWLRLTGSCTGASVLTTLQRLSHLDVRMARVDDASLGALEERGVTVLRRGT
jgi:hypothetical protein